MYSNKKMVGYREKGEGSTLTVITSVLWNCEFLFCCLYNEHTSLSGSLIPGGEYSLEKTLMLGRIGGRRRRG